MGHKITKAPSVEKEPLQKNQIFQDLSRFRGHSLDRWSEATNLAHQSFECFWIVNGDLRKHLAVQNHLRLFESRDQTAVADVA